MESNSKRRWLTKGKLVMSFHRLSKSPSSVQFSSKANQQSPPASTASAGFHVDEKKFAISSSPMKQKSFVGTMDGGVDLGGHVEGAGGAGAGVAGEESVDLRAATYISYVQERFRLERSD